MATEGLRKRKRVIMTEPRDRRHAMPGTAICGTPGFGQLAEDRSQKKVRTRGFEGFPWERPGRAGEIV